MIPLGKLSHFSHEKMAGLTPIIEYENEAFILLTPQLTSMHANLLRSPVGSLIAMRDDLIAAIDFAITGI
ncbi:MAG: toxin CcdB [Oleiphilaceae bacterium]